MADKRKLQGNIDVLTILEPFDLWEPLFWTFFDYMTSFLFLAEIDRCIKKVQEGVEIFDEIWEKVSGIFFDFRRQ